MYIQINLFNSLTLSRSPILVTQPPPTLSQISSHSHGHSHSLTTAALNSSSHHSHRPTQPHSQPHCLTTAPLSHSHSPSSLRLPYVLLSFFFLPFLFGFVRIWDLRDCQGLGSPFLFFIFFVNLVWVPVRVWVRCHSYFSMIWSSLFFFFVFAFVILKGKSINLKFLCLCLCL